MQCSNGMDTRVHILSKVGGTYLRKLNSHDIYVGTIIFVSEAPYGDPISGEEYTKGLRKVCIISNFSTIDNSIVSVYTLKRPPDARNKWPLRKLRAHSQHKSEHRTVWADRKSQLCYPG